MILSSDSISRLKVPVVILKLATVDITGKTNEKIIEMNLEETRLFLTTLQAAQQVYNRINLKLSI